MVDAPLGMLAPDAKKDAPTMGLFAKKPKDTAPANQYQDVANEVNASSRRLRVVEDRVNNVREKIQLMEESQLSSQRALHNELRAMNSDILELKRTIREMEIKLISLVGEVSQAAQRQEVMVLKKYIEIWDPMRFITHEQVERVVRDILENGPAPQPIVHREEEKEESEEDNQ